MLNTATSVRNPTTSVRNTATSVSTKAPSSRRSAPARSGSEPFYSNGRCLTWLHRSVPAAKRWRPPPTSSLIAAIWANSERTYGGSCTPRPCEIPRLHSSDGGETERLQARVGSLSFGYLNATGPRRFRSSTSITGAGRRQELTRLTSSPVLSLTNLPSSSCVSALLYRDSTYNPLSLKSL
jgi:hypothetical protein